MDFLWFAAEANVWVTALVGLLGVLVGGLLQAAREFVLARRQERAAAVAAARLVNAEVARTGLILAAARDHRDWAMLGVLDAPRVWEAQQGALALHLRDDDWPLVVWAYTQLDALQVLSHSTDKPDKLDDAAVDFVDGALWHLARANNVLRPASRRSRAARAEASDSATPLWARTARPPKPTASTESEESTQGH